MSNDTIPPTSILRLTSGRVLLRLLATGTCWIFLLGCESRAPQPPQVLSSPAASSQPQIAEVGRADMSLTVEIPATVEGYEVVMLKSRLEGYVGQVSVDIGDEVKKEDLLARLDVPEMLAEEERQRKMIAKSQADLQTRRAEQKQAEAQLSEKEALLRQRQVELRRIQGLVDGGALNREKLEEAKFAVDAVNAALERVQADISAAGALVMAAEADVEVANAELRKALSMASYLEIRAPFDGLITSRNVDPGQLVRSSSEGGTDLFTMENVSRLRVVFHLPMENAGALTKGAPVKLFGILGHPGESIEGSVARTAKSFDRNSRMMRVEMDLDNPIDPATKRRRLRSGDYGKAMVTLATYRNAATVPPSAVVVDESGGRHVVEVDDQNVCHHRPIVVLVQQQDQWGVTQPDGTSLGADRIIAQNAKDFDDGQPLELDLQPPADSTVND